MNRRKPKERQRYSMQQNVFDKEVVYKHKTRECWWGIGTKNSYPNERATGEGKVFCPFHELLELKEPRPLKNAQRPGIKVCRVVEH